MRIVMCAVAILLCFTSGLARAGVEGCPNCAVKVTLSRKQAECVSKRVDSLLLRPTGTVFFDASTCGQAPGTMIASNPKIIPPTPAKAPDDLWLLLTKRQLACLKQKLGAVPPDQVLPIEIALDEISCGAPKP